MKPSYQRISPTLGELVWNVEPTDELLSIQFAYLNYVQTNFSTSILEVRQGFTRLSLLWKNLASQQEFVKLVDTLHLSPEPLPEKVWQVPVCYHPEYGQDLEDFVKSKNLSVAEVIQLHTQPRYRIHFFGFLPGLRTWCRTHPGFCIDL